MSAALKYGAWQPIETAPKDGRSIIGWNGDRVAEMSWTDTRDDNDNYGWCESGFTDGGMLYWCNNIADPTPTHWMPLPEPPK
jgi:hypothetical protein